MGDRENHGDTIMMVLAVIVLLIGGMAFGLLLAHMLWA